MFKRNALLISGIEPVYKYKLGMFVIPVKTGIQKLLRMLDSRYESSLRVGTIRPSRFRLASTRFKDCGNDILIFCFWTSFICLILSSCVHGNNMGTDLLDGIGQALDTKAGQTDGSPSSSDGDEIAVGRQIAGNLLGASPLVKDNALQKYVNSVGRWVANQGERPDLEWHFGVIDSSDVNAFAMPGGYIFITQGLYRLLENEAQLAGVLSHEIAHVVRKHHYRVIQQARVVDFGSKLLSQKIAQDNELVQRLIGSGAEVVARGLDKNAEYEADRMGVVLSARAGYDQYALAEVLQQMGHYSKEDDSVKLLFKTHPHPDDRLTRLDEAMGDKLDDHKGATVSERFYRLKKK